MDSSIAIDLTGLLGLPPELIDAIFTKIHGSYETFRSLARVCRKLHTLANPIVYQSVIIRKPANGEKFAWTITHSPHLIPLVRELQIHYHGTDDDEPFCSPEDFEPVLAQLVDLESLVVKSDYFDDERPNLFCQPRILPALRSCHLGFDYGGESTWILHPYEAVFFHPGLRTLTITGACVQTVWSHLTGAPASRSTQLEELRILNCDLSHHDIAAMISYPRALKHFTFKGQGPDPIVTGYERVADRDGYIEVLKSHASSLESMDLDLYFNWEKPIDLSDFQALKRLTMSPRMLVGDVDYKRSLGKVLPSSLEQLTFRYEPRLPDHRHGSRVTMLSEGFHIEDIRELIRGGKLPHLSRFICGIPESTTRDWLDEVMVDANHLNVFDSQSFAQDFEELGVHFSVVRVDDPFLMPENESFPCSCWSYQHRFDDTFPW